MPFFSKNNIPKNIIISRTDSIGDVVLTLPVAAVLKQYFPDITIGFMGKNYTRPVIEACKYVDAFIEVDEFMQKKVLLAGEAPQCILHVLPLPRIAKRAQQLGIPLRIGTVNRLYHWFTCNKLVKLSRKNSNLHEAQLNLILLKALGIQRTYTTEQIGQSFGLVKLQPLPLAFASLIKKEKYNLILHPKSQGNGREWPLENYIKLINLLDASRFNIFISGTEKEKERMQLLFDKVGTAVTDITGKMTLPEFIAFINQCDGLVASGTGPIHVAAALEKDALGIYPPIRPIHPGRWGPLGPNAHALVVEKDCMDCKGNSAGCHCIAEVPPEWLRETLEKKYLDKRSKASF
jgi:heptosyltransferase-3